jgi:hypothetical protein
MGRHLPADHAKGDANTIGGYAAVHARPAAFEGSDGFSYSVELVADATGDPVRPFGAYFLFLRWRRVGAPGVEGHLETSYLAWGATAAEALAAIGALPLQEVRAQLELCIDAAEPAAPRRWWDVMREDDPADDAR